LTGGFYLAKAQKVIRIQRIGLRGELILRLVHGLL